MMVVKNKSISLLLELNYFLLQILREKNSILLTPDMATMSRGCKPRIRRPPEILFFFFFMGLCHGCLIHFVNNAKYASMLAIELEKLPVNDKTTASSQTNMSPTHYIIRYQTLQT